MLLEWMEHGHKTRNKLDPIYLNKRRIVVFYPTVLLFNLWKSYKNNPDFMELLHIDI